MDFNHRKHVDPSVIFDMAEKLTTPHLLTAERLSDAEKKEAITTLVMGLAMGIAMIGVTFLTPEATDFGKHVGDYITETMEKMREELENVSSKRSTEKATGSGKSLWG